MVLSLMKHVAKNHGDYCLLFNKLFDSWLQIDR